MHPLKALGAMLGERMARFGPAPPIRCGTSLDGVGCALDALVEDEVFGHTCMHGGKVSWISRRAARWNVARRRMAVVGVRYGGCMFAAATGVARAMRLNGRRARVLNQGVRARDTD